MEILAIIAAIVALISFIAMIAGWIWLLVLAFKEHPLWGVGTLLVPFVGLIFAIMYWKKAYKPFLLNLIGSILFIACMAAAMIPALLKVQERALMVKSQANLSQIGKCVHIYKLDYGRGFKYPDSLKELYDKKILMEPRVYLSPAKGFDRPISDTEFQCDYCYFFNNRFGAFKNASDASTTILAYDPHFSDFVVVLYVDGHTDHQSKESFMAEYEAQGNKLKELGISFDYETGITKIPEQPK